MLTSKQKTPTAKEHPVNSYFLQDIVDHRHAELMARAEQSRRYQAARAVPAVSTRRPAPRGGAVRRPFRALHAWLVAGVL
jgi:hypothetical protein